MARDASLEDLRGFMRDDEREYFDAPERTEGERKELLAGLQSEWQSIPDPEPNDLKPPYMPHADWAAYENGSKHVIPFHTRRWKKQRRAAVADMQPRQKDSTTEPEKPRGIRVPGSVPSLTPQEERDARLLAFMPEQVRAAYDAADFEHRQIIWEANKRTFEEAEIRKAQKLLREQERMEEIFDALQRLREDPEKAHLLPSKPNPSSQELEQWYKDKFETPVDRIPFPNLTEQQIRQDRMWRDVQATGKADPNDIAEEEAEAERYRRSVAEKRNKKRAELDAEFAPVKKPAEPLVEASKQSATISHTLSAFIDSNLTWGSLGVIVAGLATLVSSAILLAFGWLMLTISLYRHFFKGRAWYWQVLGTLLTGLGIGLILLIVWLKFQPH
jgi:hypothetical protein